MDHAQRRALTSASAGLTTVFEPDHPLLVRGPEALIGSNGNLCAVLTPQSLEENNPAHLLSRLIGIRLALPRDCRTLLLLHKGQESRFEELWPHFGLTTDHSDPAITKYLRDSRDHGRSRPVEPGVIVFSTQKFDVALQVTEQAFREARVYSRTTTISSRIEDQPPPRDYAYIMNGPYKYEPQNRVRVGDQQASLLSATKASGLMRQLRYTSSGHLLESFGLDDGAPVPKRGLPHLALAEHAEETVGMRSKAVYASAFSGVTILPSMDLWLADHMVARMKEYTYQRMGEVTFL